MRIAVVGGGPGGLYLATLVRQVDPAAEVTVWERNAPDDTFGFGVVFSDQTLSGIVASDRGVHDDMAARFATWEDVDVHVDGQQFSVGGNGFAAMTRRDLLDVLQRRALAAGVTVHFRAQAPDVAELMASHDLVVAADGVNSVIRERFADRFGTTVDEHGMKYMWLGTSTVYDAFKFFVVDTEWGVMQAHAYPMNGSASTFIAEMTPQVWHKAGFDAVDAATLPPGVSDERSIGRVREVFADALAGGDLQANNSKWVSFRTVRNATLVHDNLVLLGDAAHTAHFSIGSGTKLAMEDALALAACLQENDSVAAAVAAYDAERQPVVRSTQRSALASMEWFEELAQYRGQDPIQFVFNLMTRSRRVTYGNLRERDPDFVDVVDADLLARERRTGRVPADAVPAEGTPPMFLPLQLRDVRLRNRVVVSAMDMYSARDGVPGDFHLVHLGARAMGGAGLVMTEMVCVAPEARITPACAGLWNDEQEQAWARIVDHGHAHGAAMGLQLGHAGRKGATKVMWEGIDQPLDEGGWPLVAASPLPYLPHSQVPAELTRADLDRITAQFVESARRGARAGFDVLELHCAHGYLLSGFVTPVSNRRTDEYGGELDNRLRYPLEVLRAVRAAWPQDRPVFVRVSATDWVPDGLTAEESVAVAEAFAREGADLVDVSTGQTSPEARPAYGRTFQTPYADRIRQRVGVATMAVGSISSWDDVNTIVAAGRADLCAVGRPHLYDPHWTLHAAAEQGVEGPWPAPYRAGSRTPAGGRTADPRPRLTLGRTAARPARSRRWQPAL